MPNYRLKLTTLSPVHIGDGLDLHNKIDFVIDNGNTWRLNLDEILEAKPLPFTSGKSYTLPGDMLTDPDFDEERFFRYILQGTPKSGKNYGLLKSCIKDCLDRPYIPGSSLKGAVRTALAWHGFSEKKINLRDYRFDHDENKKPGLSIENNIFGKDPNHDILRTIQVSDCFGSASTRKTLEVLNSQVIPSNKGKLTVSLEAIRRNQVFYGSLKIDDFLFSDQAEKKLQFSQYKPWIEGFMTRVQNYSVYRIQELRRFFHDIPEAGKLVEFYNWLDSLQISSNQALIQLGWGTGWDGKTLASRISQNDALFEKIIREYGINPAGRSSGRRAGDDFPKTRKVKVSPKDGSFSQPLGWIALELEEDKSCEK